MLRLATAAAALAAAAAQPDTTINVTWGTVQSISKTNTALQVVVNPLIARDSPVHDQIFASLAGLGADHVRYGERRFGVAGIEGDVQRRRGY
jgi:hypothetical protein